VKKAEKLTGKGDLPRSRCKLRAEPRIGACILARQAFLASCAPPQRVFEIQQQMWPMRHSKAAANPRKLATSYGAFQPLIPDEADRCVTGVTLVVVLLARVAGFSQGSGSMKLPPAGAVWVAGGARGSVSAPLAKAEGRRIGMRSMTVFFPCLLSGGCGQLPEPQVPDGSASECLGRFAWTTFLAPSPTSLGVR